MSIPQFSILTDPLVRQKSNKINQLDGIDSREFYDTMLDMHRTAHAVARSSKFTQSGDVATNMSNMVVAIKTKESPTANVKGKAAKKAAKRNIRTVSQ